MYPQEHNHKRKKIFLFLGIFILMIFLLLFFLWKKGPESFQKKTIQNLFPFGEKVRDMKEQQKAEREEQQKAEREEQQKAKPKPAPRLRQVSSFPTGGFLPFKETRDRTVKDIIVNAQGEKQEVNKTIQVEDYFVRYNDIQYGNIYESKLDPYTIHNKQLAENFIPNVEEAYFSPHREHFALQYWNPSERLAETYLGKITKKTPQVEPCPYHFDSVEIGDENDNVHDLHVFLNKDPRTRVSLEGVNSPGNESYLATEKTITAIKNFQSVHGLDIDGNIGPGTKKKLLEICDKEQEEKAKEELKKEKYQYTVTGSFLPKGIISLSMSPDGKKVFYLKKDAKGVVGVTKDFDSGKNTTIFESPYTEWLSDWNENTNIQITTKPSYLSDGYTYGLNARTGDYHKSFPQKKGLLVLPSPDNTKILYLDMSDEEPENYIYFKDTQKSVPLLDVHTFPEKCTWTKDSQTIYCFVPIDIQQKNEYPDRWYQGLTLFSDQLWKIDGNTTKETLVSDIPQEYQKHLDAIKVNIDEDGAYLYFIDKGTENLWSYRLIDA